MAEDKETIEAVGLWFQFRYINDNVRFPAFFQRYVDMYYGKYRKMLDAEAADFDPLINIRRELTRARSASKSGSRKADMTYGTSGTRDDAGKGTRSESMTANGTGAGSTLYKGGETIARAGSREQDDPEISVTEGYKDYKESTKESGSQATADAGSSGGRRVEKAMPQSMSYNSAVTGTIPALAWGAPSGQMQQDGKDDKAGSSTSEGESTKTIAGSKTRDEVHKGPQTGSDTGTEERAYTGREDSRSDSSEDEQATAGEEEAKSGGSWAESREEDRTEKTAGDETEEGSEQVEGLDGVLQSEAYRDYVAWIMGSNALKWFIGHLQPCFSPFFKEEDNEA